MNVGFAVIEALKYQATKVASDSFHMFPDEPDIAELYLYFSEELHCIGWFSKNTNEFVREAAIARYADVTFVSYEIVHDWAAVPQGTPVWARGEVQDMWHPAYLFAYFPNAVKKFVGLMDGIADTELYADFSECRLRFIRDDK